MVVPTQFPSLPIAIAAARAGDTILVRQGTYADIGTIQKGLTIHCEPGVFFLRNTMGGSFQIIGIPASESLTWRGGLVGIQANHQFTNLYIDKCQGRISIEGLVMRQLPVVVRSSTFVSMHDLKASGIGVYDSTVSISECSIFGGAQYGVTADNSTVSISRSSMTSMIGSGLTLRLGSRVTVGVGTSIAAGQVIMTQRPAIDAISGVQLISQGQPIQGGAIVIWSSVPGLAVPTVIAGQTFRVDVFAAPASTTATLLSWLVHPLPTPFGDLWVSPLSPVIDIGNVPSIGMRQVSLIVPSVPVGTTIALQPVSLLVSGELTFGVPSHVVF